MSCIVLKKKFKCCQPTLQGGNSPLRAKLYAHPSPPTRSASISGDNEIHPTRDHDFDHVHKQKFRPVALQWSERSSFYTTVKLVKWWQGPGTWHCHRDPFPSRRGSCYSNTVHLSNQGLGRRGVAQGRATGIAVWEKEVFYCPRERDTVGIAVDSVTKRIESSRHEHTNEKKKKNCRAFRVTYLPGYYILYMYPLCIPLARKFHSSRTFTIQAVIQLRPVTYTLCRTISIGLSSNVRKR